MIGPRGVVAVHADGRTGRFRFEEDGFLTYDGRLPQWVRFAAHSNAQHYGMVGKRVDNVWSWSYVLPGRSGSAAWTKN